jgi:hypothetical protein
MVALIKKFQITASNLCSHSEKKHDTKEEQARL